MNEQYQFWMVWNMNGRAPSVQHAQGALAQREAERLAAQYPGQRFYVVKAIRYAQTNACAVTELQPPPPGYDGTCPF